MQTVFLTGFPGLISRALVRKLLAIHQEVKTYLLVEKKNLSEAEKYIAHLPMSQASRVKVIVGDVTALDVGLSGEEANQITSEVTHIFHLAALQNPGAGRRRLRTVNVKGTKNVLSLARDCRKLQRFVHFSTCFVSGERAGVVMEDELEAGQKFHNLYEESKFQAEQVVRQGMNSLPITILRPSIVVGDSTTGEIDRFNGLYFLGILLAAAPAAIPLPLPSAGIAPLHLVPIDFVVNAALLLSEDSRAIGKTFHVVDPNPLSARKVYGIVASRTGKPTPRFRTAGPFTKALFRVPRLDYFASFSRQAIDCLDQLTFYNCLATSNLLAESGIRCPAFPEYVDNLLQFVRNHLSANKITGSSDLQKPLA